METISLSEALPPEKDRLDLIEGVELAITGIVIQPRAGHGKAWETAHINGLKLPGLTDFVKYKTSSGPVVRDLKRLLDDACFTDGTCKKPVRVRVEGRDYTNGRGLCLVDA